MNKPSKSKADSSPTDSETLRAPLDRAMRDADVELWPRQLMHRTESEQEYNQRMNDCEQDRYDMQEAE